MGDVFEGTDLQGQTAEGKVAIKVVSPDRLAALEEHQRNTMLARFEREAAALKSLHHPFTVRCYDHGRTPEGMPWMVLELLSGRTVGWWIRRHGRIEPARAAHIGRQVALSLAEAHAVGIVHRDVKPDNMHLDDRADMDWVRLFDFGVAQPSGAKGSNKLTADGTTVGTVRYMASEQATAATELTGAADFYALGVSLYEMLTGQPPFDGANDMDVLVQHVHRQAPRLPSLGLSDGAAKRWQALLDGLLVKAPSERLGDGVEIAGRLLALAEAPDATHVVDPRDGAAEPKEDSDAQEVGAAPVPGVPSGLVGDSAPRRTLTDKRLVAVMLLGLLGLFGLLYFLPL